MGANDWHWDPTTNDLLPGLTTVNELEGVVREIRSPEHAQALYDTIADHLETLKVKELPMLKGKGFIVVDPSNPRFAGEEYENFDEAKDVASNASYASGAGMAIIYAPVLVLKPKRETAQSQPSELLKQLGLPSGQAVGALPPKVDG